MTNIYFVRHAQPDFSIEDRIRPLTKQGEEDTKVVLEYFKDKIIDAFYSSPYKRSIDTIKSSALFFNKDIIVDERFREREKGEKGNNTEILRLFMKY